ncbi:DUF2507 domain-containing protein [Bacillus mangrovi]|uniref:DUF2507 domain-containing protein n=1 Tax=Metabacillus mangrovi TaxID=1491830 RepID=A0A7X2S3D7_9BACI|nr:YslB family protein [Metabacillus mangrovi]MTH52922.1 DUF2507 domain-containing protein [Metabacillus mangrovi]
MKNNRNQPDAAALEELQVPAFSSEILREVLLPELLGQDYPAMLYWAGRKLARRYPLETAEDLIPFFIQAGWGELELLHRKQGEMEFELKSSLIQERMQTQKEPSFLMEAGFLAEQIQRQGDFAAEGYEQVKRRTGKVVLSVKWDKKDSISE